MKVSREQAARNREAVVDAASRLFRAHGVEGVAIGDIMRAGGLTHGGFYNQFESKEALAAEACACALERSAERWRAIVDQEGKAALATITASYLSPQSREAPETGCALIALAPDAARKGGALAQAFGEGFEALAAVLQNVIPGEARDATLARLAQMVGAMVLARGVADPRLSDAILAASRKVLAVDP